MSDSDDLFIAPNGLVYSTSGNSANCTVSVCPIEYSVYGYRPSLAASGALIGLYGICVLIQILYGWRYKTWGFTAAMLLGCVCEILGYVGRIMMYYNPWANGGFTMQIVLITIGPVFFSAAIYVLLAQIVQYISVRHSRFQPKWFYWIFIPCDIVSLILQAIGGGMSSSSDGSSQAGVDIALAGLSFQVVTLVAFIVLTIDYFIRSRSVWKVVHWPTSFAVFVSSLSFATIVITARCCYRVYELNEGYTQDSEALRDQPLFIGLESVMIIVAAYALILAHPGPVFKRGNSSHLVNDEKSTQFGNGQKANDSALSTPEDSA